MAISMLQRLYASFSLQSQAGERVDQWINDDIKPLPPHRRTWGVWSFVSFWAINNLIMLNFTVGSTLIAFGLSVWQAILAVMIGKSIIMAVAVFNGWAGAEWHIGFPVISRYVWGMYGSYAIIAQRILLSCVWMACQGWTGALCMSTILSAVFPSYHHMHNTLPAGTHMETKQFVGFILFSLLTCCFLWVRPEKTAKMLIVMNCVSFASLLGITIWSIRAAHGVGAIISAAPKAQGSYETGWAIVQSVSCVVGAIAVGLSNQADFSRFAHKLGDQVAGQLFSIPIFGVLVPLLGCITASATDRMYGEVIWNPPVLVNKWLDMDYTVGSRIGAIFTSLGLIVSQIGINLIDNAYAGGMDLAGMLPRWINIRRGSYLTLIVSVLFQPWQLLSSASVFLNVLSAYAVVLGPLTGIMMTDYWFIRHRKLKLTHLYRADSSSIYWFWHGFNLRAFSAWTIGFVPLLPGYINHINPDINVPEAMRNLYNLAFPLGLLVSGLSFYVFCRVWRPQGLDQVDDTDVFGTFTDAEADRLGIVRNQSLNDSGIIETEKTSSSTTVEGLVLPK